jgi:hypothetical protein
MSRVDVLGYAASATVLATFCMTRMIYLRLLAIVSNALFICFGALAHIHPVLMLHLVLLPINVARLMEIALSRCGAAPVVNPNNFEFVQPFAQKYLSSVFRKTKL